MSDGVQRLISYTWKELVLPEDAVDLALSTTGSSATASTAGRDPMGAINGNHSLAGWAQGRNGWEATATPTHPNWWGDWLEIAFPEPRPLDTIIVYTLPEHVLGRNRLGLRDYQLQLRAGSSDDWETVDTVRGNTSGTLVHRFAERPVQAIRLWITAANTGDELSAMSYAPNLARVLEVEAYRLGDADLWHEEERQVPLDGGHRYRLAILRDDFPAVAGSTPASPESLAELFREAGFTVTFLDGRDLTSPEVLSATNFDVFVHPYGPAFPLNTALYQYLQDGGHLLALGGYAFTEALQWENGHWVATGFDPGLSASVCRRSDYFTELREQLRLFGAPGHSLRDVAYIATAPEQSVVATPVHREGSVSGPLAVAIVGDGLSLEEAEASVADGRWQAYAQKVREALAGQAPLRGFATEHYRPLFSRPCSRWLPLLSAYDRYGRERGTVLAALLHHDGLYRGSRWAYCGVNDVDLFGSGEEAMRAALLETVRFLLAGLTLHNVASEFDCYRQGEAVTVSAVVDNAGREPTSARLVLRVLDGDSGSVAFEAAEDLTLEPGGWRKVSATWKPERFAADLYRVEAALSMGDAPYDRAESGFAAWNDRTIKAGPSLEYRDNYFRFQGKRRYLQGVRDDGLHLHGQTKEDALWWGRQYRMMRDYGVDVVSPVFFSVYIEGLGWGEPDDDLIPEVVLRQLDAQVLLSQKHGLVYAPCLFFLAEDKAEYRPQLSRRVARVIGERYKHVPGIMFYIFDDGVRDDPRFFNAWAKEVVAGLRECGRNYIVTAEQATIRSGADVFRDMTQELDFAANSCYHGAENPAASRLLDMRVAGKSWSNAEFGRQASTGSPADLHPYLLQPHHAFGMGYSLALNWKWKDNDHCIFPWGVVYPGDWVPKDELYAFRNEALLFRHFQPYYRTPPVLVVLPRQHWAKDYMHLYPYLMELLGLLIDQGVDFAPVDETGLAHLPEDAATLVYPIPQCAPDYVFPLLRDFVARGGNLWLNGADRALAEDTAAGAALRELVGAGFAGWIGGEHLLGQSLARRLPRVAIAPTGAIAGLAGHHGQPCVRLSPPSGQVAAADEDGNPVVLRNRLDRGLVIYSTDVTLEGARTTLPAFLNAAGVPRHPAGQPGVQVFSLPSDEAQVYTVTTDTWDQAPRLVDFPAGPYRPRLGIGGQGVGLLAINRSGQPCAVEGLSLESGAGQPIIQSTGHVMLTAKGAAGLSEADGLLLTTIEPGEFRLRTDQPLHALVGDIVDGHWQERERLPVSWHHNMLELQMDSSAARSLIVLTTETQQQANLAWVEELLQE